MAGIKDGEAKMFQEVQEMLEKVYSDGRIPDYEVNSTTVGILHEIAARMKKDADVNEAQVKYYRGLTEEYDAKCEDIKEKFDVVGLSVDDFSKEYVAASEAMARAASMLDLKEPTATNFLLALNDLSRKKLEISNEKIKWSRKLEKLMKKITALLEQLEHLTKDVETTKEKHKIQSSEAAKRKNQTSFLSNKIEEYRRKVHNFEEKLKEAGCQPPVYHSAVMEKYQELKELEEKLDGVKVKLEGYNNLPPNENLARLKVEEAKQELFNLEKELQEKIELKSKEAAPGNF